MADSDRELADLQAQLATAQGNGWVALLHPLTPGTHTIVGSGSSTFTTTITVQPGH